MPRSITGIVAEMLRLVEMLPYNGFVYCSGFCLLCVLPLQSVVRSEPL